MRIGNLRSIAIGLAACAAMASLGNPAQAKPGLDPNTGVADDGSVTVARATNGSQGTSGYAGSGVSGGDGASFEYDLSKMKIGPAMAPDIGTQSVFLPDGRVRANPTTGFPSRATVFMTRVIPQPGGGQQIIAWCTGWMYAPDILATAGHCVHTGGSGGSWYPIGEFRIWPGANGTTNPYGLCTARRLHSVVGWTQDGLRNFDYAAIKLNCTVGNTVGWYGMWWQSASLTGLATTIRGYPVDKPFGQQWFHSDQVRVTEARRIFYQNDTFNGQSGSPVYQNRPAGAAFCANGPCAMGIHTTGGSTNNGGTRIVEPLFNNLITWRDTP